MKKWPRTPHHWKRMCTVLWRAFILTGFQEGLSSVVKQPGCCLNGFPEDSMLFQHYCCLYKYAQNNWSNELKFVQLKAFCRRKNRTGSGLFLFFFSLEAELDSQVHFSFIYNLKTSLQFLLQCYVPFICNFRFLSPVSWDLQSSKISQFTFKMFWFFSQTLASVLNTEWLKAVCSVRTVIVFKQGSLCLFKRMGKWLSWQIRLKKQASHSLAQMSTFATWLAFWGILNKTCLCAGGACALLDTWLRNVCDEELLPEPVCLCGQTFPGLKFLRVCFPVS